MIASISFLLADIIVNAIKIPIEAFKSPFQTVSISRREPDNKNATHGVFGIGEDKDKEYIKTLELQVQNLQKKVDSAKDINVSPTFNGIVIFLCCLTVLSWVGLFLASILYGSTPNEAQTAFINTCSESAKLLPTALISLLGGKVIR